MDVTRKRRRHLPYSPGRAVAPARPHAHGSTTSARLSAGVIAQLVADYDAGHSTTMLMRDYRLGKGTVLSILAEHGVTMRGQGIPDDRLSEVIELYKSGWSLMRVGEHFGCSGETVRLALLAAGVAMRPRWHRGGR